MAPPDKPTILLAEDERSVRAVAKSALARGGYAVLEAADPAEALELARSHPEPIHLLVTDVVMPGMSGRQLAKRFRELRPGALVLYMSGYPEEVVLRPGVSAAGVYYLQKPFSIEELVGKVREVLGRTAGE